MTAQSKSNNQSRGHDMSAMLTANERALKISAALTGVYFFVEVALGIASGSIAVLSDAFHTFSAVGGVLLASSRAASRRDHRIVTGRLAHFAQNLLARFLMVYFCS